MILNRAPSKSVRWTPYEIWYGKKPNFSFFKIWGCNAYVKKVDSDKLEPKSQKCLFVGYPKETNGYYFYYPPEHKVFVSKHVVFLEKEFLSGEDSGRTIDLDEINEQRKDIPLLEPEPEVSQEVVTMLETSQRVVTSHEPNTQDPRRSSRIRREPERYGFLMPSQGDMFIMEDNEPITYEETVCDIDSERWLEAMRSKMDTMYTNHVWNLVEPPERV